MEKEVYVYGTGQREQVKGNTTFTYMEQVKGNRSKGAGQREQVKGNRKFTYMEQVKGNRKTPLSNYINKQGKGNNLSETKCEYKKEGNDIKISIKGKEMMK